MGSVPVGTFDNLDQLTAAASAQPATAPEPAPPAPTSPADTSLGPLLAQGVLSSMPGEYITLDDVIQMSVWNSNANLTSVTAIFRVLKPDGTLVIEALPIAKLTADRTENQAQMPQLEGFLISIAVQAPSVAVSRGQCYVRIGVFRGASGALFPVLQLTADYLSNGSQPSWPNGRIVSAVEGPGFVTAYLTAGNTVGANQQQLQPANTRWRVLGVNFQLNTSAAVANRFPGVAIRTGQGANPPNTVFLGQTQSIVTASLLATIQYGADTPIVNPDAADQVAPLPEGLVIAAQGAVLTNIKNIQAADVVGQMTTFVEEWIDV